MHTEIDRHVFGSINTPTGGQIMHLYLWCTDVTHRHTLTINTHRHLHTQVHLAEEDNPCKRFGRGLIWSNGGSESRFVFPALVRLRSSLPADATSCILTGSCYRKAPTDAASCIFNVGLLFVRLGSLNNPCKRGADKTINFEKLNPRPLLCFCLSVTSF